LAASFGHSIVVTNDLSAHLHLAHLQRIRGLIVLLLTHPTGFFPGLGEFDEVIAAPRMVAVVSQPSAYHPSWPASIYLLKSVPFYTVPLIPILVQVLGVVGVSYRRIGGHEQARARIVEPGAHIDQSRPGYQLVTGG